jgi:ABC-type transport system involved in Fe-S cluster assembly fused permease/ATPase subunit
VLFNDSIFHNIAYSQPSATEAEVVLAAKQAVSAEFSASFG